MSDAALRSYTVLRDSVSQARISTHLTRPNCSGVPGSAPGQARGLLENLEGPPELAGDIAPKRWRLWDIELPRSAAARAHSCRVLRDIRYVATWKSFQVLEV